MGTLLTRLRQGAAAQGTDSAAAPPTSAGTGDPTAPSGQRTGVIADLPGLGQTFLDSQIAPMVSSFTRNAHDNGVDLQFLSGWRSPGQQADMRLKGLGTTPAAQSLHSAGLAVDVNYKDLPTDAQRQVVRDAATQAGLSWGGTFKTPDPNHFYFDPGGDRGALIDNFTNQLRNWDGIPWQNQ
jgi:hypothetical protein